MQEVLHDEDGLVVAVVLEDERGIVQLESSEDGPDLTVPHEVVVVVDGRGRDVDVEGPRRATAVIIDELAEEPDPITLMVRVHEFFEGWELFAEPE